MWLTGARYFTKLNLQNAYHQLRIKEGDEWKTAFCTQYSHFKYIIMPFELTNAPAFFQTYINKSMAELLNIICVVYLNDILIYTSDENSKTHWKTVRKVLEHLKEFRLFLKLKKYKFMTTEVEFLKFIMSSKGIFINIYRVKTVTEWLKPTSIKKIQTFLEFMNFYRRFIAQYSKITASITDYLRILKEKKRKKENWFTLNNKIKEVFKQLKWVFEKVSLLTHFDLKVKICVKTDVFVVVIAEILT